MKDIDLLPREGAFYKANLHAHTTFSDGRWTPQRLKEEYQSRGYAVVAVTDHRFYRWHQELDGPGFLTLAAFEGDLNQGSPDRLFPTDKTYHLNFYDTRPQTRPAGYQPPLPPQGTYGDVAALNAYLAQMNDDGFLCCYNHPWWSMQDHGDYKGLKGIFAMEIYNHGCEHDGLYGYAPQAYDELLRQGLRIGCLATDDNHDVYEPDHPLSDSFGGVTMLKLPGLSYANVIDALKNRRYYATTGPELYDLAVRGGALHVRCSPVERIYAVLAGRATYKAVAPAGRTITEAVFPLKGDEGWLRIDCQDGQRRHAYSPAYFLDEMQ